MEMGNAYKKNIINFKNIEHIGPWIFKTHRKSLLLCSYHPLQRYKIHFPLGLGRIGEWARDLPPPMNHKELQSGQPYACTPVE